jgi:hypothetical protein
VNEPACCSSNVMFSIRESGEGLQLFRVLQHNIITFPYRTFYSIL